MGLFGPYIYENKNGDKFFLHLKRRGERELYYFSKDPKGALKGLPKGFEVFENETSGLPMLRKKEPGIALFKKGKNLLGKKGEQK